MQFSLPALLISLVALEVPSSVQGHGFMIIPTSRNHYARVHGTSWGAAPAIPPAEYCEHCLNANHGVCGISEQGTDYDAWKDSEGNDMPWISQQVYEEGQVIEVYSHLTANHAGHMMIRGCAGGKESTQECFDSNVFEFVEDVAYNMPKDPAHPDRGYYYGGVAANGFDYVMKFQLPPGLVGEKVLLQWEYFTANSCSPVGYEEYFGGANSDQQALDDDNWNPGIPTCNPTYPSTFEAAAPPERFINCAEVTIMPAGGGGGATPTNPPTNAPAPAATPAPTGRPTNAPTPGATSTPVTPAPTSGVAPTDAPKPPTMPPQNSPTAAPAPPSGKGCCSHDFKACATWGNESQTACEALGGMIWLQNGVIEGSCLARYNDCTQATNSCCNGLICMGSEHYKQCKSPGYDL